MTQQQLERMLERATASVKRLNADLVRVCPSTYEQIMAPPNKKRIRQRIKPAMNQLEIEAWERLKLMHPQCELRCQCLTFVLANGVRYTPDIVVFETLELMRCVRVTCYEVKGKHAWDDALVKIKVAANQYKMFRWVLTWKEGDIWHEQEVVP